MSSDGRVISTSSTSSVLMTRPPPPALPLSEMCVFSTPRSISRNPLSSSRRFCSSSCLARTNESPPGNCAVKSLNHQHSVKGTIITTRKGVRGEGDIRVLEQLCIPRQPFLEFGDRALCQIPFFALPPLLLSRDHKRRSLLAAAAHAHTRRRLPASRWIWIRR
jgi:hypothetical protein